jgi:23S rRNA (adenine2503-C2)-methyltransferase
MQIEKNRRAVSKDLLRNFFVTGDKAFVESGIRMVVGKGAHSFEDMTNISKETRTMLESNFVINHIKVFNVLTTER